MAWRGGGIWPKNRQFATTPKNLSAPNTAPFPLSPCPSRQLAEGCAHAAFQEAARGGDEATGRDQQTRGAAQVLMASAEQKGGAERRKRGVLGGMGGSIWGGTYHVDSCGMYVRAPGTH